MESYKFEWIEKYKKHIVLAAFSGLLIHHIILLFKIGFEFEHLMFFILSVVMYWLSWSMIYLVLGFQNINPFCPKSIFKWFCYIFMSFSALSLGLSLVSDITSPLFSASENVETLFSSSPASAGMMMAAFYLYKKYVVSLNHHVT